MLGRREDYSLLFRSAGALLTFFREEEKGSKILPLALGRLIRPKTLSFWHEVKTHAHHCSYQSIRLLGKSRLSARPGGIRGMQPRLPGTMEKLPRADLCSRPFKMRRTLP